jgi:diguanylate cyclase (GGDEF)-like protein/putative nucleotidyltransferase with HDIG domain
LAVILGGVLGVGQVWPRADGFDWWTTAAYALIIGAVSLLKVPLPGVISSLSVGFVFKLVALVQLNALETVVASTAGVVAQSFWHAEQRPHPHQVAFNICSVWISILLAQFVYLRVEVLSAEPAPALITAAAVFFLVNTWIVTGIIALTEQKSPLGIWRECFFWSFPYYLMGGGLASMVVLCLRAAGRMSALFIIPLIYLIHRSYRHYMERLESERDHAEDLAALHLRTIETLALAIEAKDQTTHDHLQRVRIYAEEIGKELGLSEDEMKALQAASLLHDIGKLAVPEHIIGKPGKLTKEEFEKVKIHPIVGADILKRVEFPYPVVPMVRSHHEKWNGTGYPDGLKGEEIPIGARILSAVDCLDALASDRQYRRALPLDEAIQVVVESSGTAYDPQIVDILKRRYVELEARATRAGAKHRQGLDTNIVVERGDAPGAGFVESVPAWSSIRSAHLEAQVYLDWTRQLGNYLNLEEILDAAVVGLRKLVPFDCIAVYIRQDGHLEPAYVNGVDSHLFSSLRIPMGDGLSGWVAENDKTILNGSAAVEAVCASGPLTITSLRGALAAPLEGTSGVIGVVALYGLESAPFSSEHLRILLGLSSRLGLVVENAIKYRDAQRSATNDYLTGLPNARALFEIVDGELARSQRENSHFALLVCDLNDFKKVNDRLGHMEGNRVLRAVAEALQANCRQYDHVGRMGGDEFVIVLPASSPEAISGRIATIKQKISETGDGVSIAIGAAFYPNDGADTESLMAAADVRMYEDKRNRANPSPPRAEAAAAATR